MVIRTKVVPPESIQELVDRLKSQEGNRNRTQDGEKC